MELSWLLVLGYYYNSLIKKLSKWEILIFVTMEAVIKINKLLLVKFVGHCIAKEIRLIEVQSPASEKCKLRTSNYNDGHQRN